MHLHFLRAIGTAMSMRAGIAADAAAALLFRILSQPALLFPPLRQVEGVEVQQDPIGDYISSYRKQVLMTKVLFIYLFILVNVSSLNLFKKHLDLLYVNLNFFSSIKLLRSTQTYTRKTHNTSFH